MSEKDETIKKEVREAYARIALQDKKTNESSCCGSGACGDDSSYTIFSEDYKGTAGYNEDADLGLGCGLPTRFATIEPGHTVLDLGSGAGNDAFVARAAVGTDGRVIGVDMTPEMITKARANSDKLGFENVEFRPGEIENLPVESDSIDVVLSNCVLNLVPNKEKAFAEIFRVLRPGGTFSISDVVLEGELPTSAMEAAELYAGCVSGALQKEDYLATILRAGFNTIETVSTKDITVPDDILERYLNAEDLASIKEKGSPIRSVTVRAEKPAMQQAGCGCVPGSCC